MEHSSPDLILLFHEQLVRGSFFGLCDNDE
jgi:hypothetical protein